MEKEYEIEEVEQNSSNKEYMMQALKEGAAWVIAYADDKLHDDKELMLEAVKLDGQNLYYASQELRDDDDVVMTAVSNKWLILKYASKRLRGNKQVVLAAVKQDHAAIEFATDEIKVEPEIKAELSKKED